MDTDCRTSTEVADAVVRDSSAVLVLCLVSLAAGSELDRALRLANRSLAAHFPNLPLKLEIAPQQFDSSDASLAVVTFRDQGGVCYVDHVRTDGYPVRGRTLLTFVENLAAYLGSSEVRLLDASLLRWRRGDRAAPLLRSPLLNALQDRSVLSYYEQFGYHYVGEYNPETIRDAVDAVRSCRELNRILDQVVCDPTDLQGIGSSVEEKLMESDEFPAKAISELVKTRLMAKDVTPSSLWRCLVCSQRRCVSSLLLSMQLCLWSLQSCKDEAMVEEDMSFRIRWTESMDT